MTPAERITRACEKLTKKGFSVEPGSWGIGWNPKRERWSALKSAAKRICPLGALVLIEQPPRGPHGSVPAAICSLLGVDASWVGDFQARFDGVIVSFEGVPEDWPADFEGSRCADEVVSHLSSSAAKSGGASSA